VIKRERELNEIARRHGFGPLQRTSGGHYVTQHLITRRKVFVSFSNSGSGSKLLQLFESDLRKANEGRANRR